MESYERPIYWSVTKVLVSSVLSILEDRGLVEIDNPIETYLPELVGSSYEGITVRNILDMATGVDCPEEYYDRSSCYYGLMETTGEAHWGEDAGDNPYAYIAALRVGKYAEQGTSFEYGSINTYILGWLVEKLTGMPFQDAFSREFWTRIGAEGDAAILAPRFGVPMFAGGFLGRPRDLARFGLLFTPSYGVVSDRKIISDEHIEMLINGGRPELLANARGGHRMRSPGKSSNTMSTSGIWSSPIAIFSRAGGPGRVCWSTLSGIWWRFLWATPTTTRVNSMCCRACDRCSAAFSEGTTVPSRPGRNPRCPK